MLQLASRPNYVQNVGLPAFFRRRARKHEWRRDSEEKAGKQVPKTYPQKNASGRWEDYHRDTCSKCGKEHFTPVGSDQQPPPYGCK